LRSVIGYHRGDRAMNLADLGLTTAFIGLHTAGILAGFSLGMSITNMVYILIIRKQLREQVNYWRDKVKSLRQNSSDARINAISIGCASGRYLERWSKSHSIEDVKLLTIQDNRLTIWSRNLIGDDVQIALTPANTQVSWIGRRYKYDPIAKWFCLEASGKKVYVTADFDQAMWNYNDKTTSLYNQIKRALNES
jgi:hypothetical protein